MALLEEVHQGYLESMTPDLHDYCFEHIAKWRKARRIQEVLDTLSAEEHSMAEVYTTWLAGRDPIKLNVLVDRAIEQVIWDAVLELHPDLEDEERSRKSAVTAAG